MAFMDAYLTDKIAWFVVETDNGTMFLPVDEMDVDVDAALACFDNEDTETSMKLVRCTEGTELTEPVKIMTAYGVRASADGYMDCTDWDIFTNKREAVKAANQLQRELDGKD